MRYLFGACPAPLLAPVGLDNHLGWHPAQLVAGQAVRAQVIPAFGIERACVVEVFDIGLDARLLALPRPVGRIEATAWLARARGGCGVAFQDVSVRLLFSSAGRGWGAGAGVNVVLAHAPTHLDFTATDGVLFLDAVWHKYIVGTYTHATGARRVSARFDAF